ncbi:Histone deacetylase-like amidohydrolase [Saezia sanguinis]|uniref:Histone deacetylase-like amidohydrolase n=1 Tax=Saezia sanguinis TaxID=1965230 RepID=A0A433SHH0_9BURK|nr:histone deacetylase family protein [Saezia sanguinis]RUS68191.1 Histone deacetylase-like amidohydrolase [Saezia sanguinis]
MGSGHPECPERLDAIEDRLIASGLADFLERRSADLASDNALMMAHSAAYLAWLKSEHELLLEEYAAGGPSYRYVDPDTTINQYTLQAIRRSAGMSIAATEAVFSGELNNAFCAVRPPGHHAERARAHGFCFVCNVALAALFALDVLGLQRVAVVDFDVHHGNGTEDILAGDERALMVSFFQHPFFPHMGVPPKADNMINIPVEHYTKGEAIRDIVQEKWLPALDRFEPQMIFISAGFDAHREDDMGQIGLVENDYAWITSQLMQVADRHAGGKIVSCLEGGYDLSALGRSVEAHIRTLAGLD